ncbi:hypothetical protein [Streptomyces sp. NPDC001153]
MWRDGVRAHSYDSWPVRDDEAADDTPVGADPAAFLAFSAGPVDGHRLSSALADYCHMSRAPRALAEVLDNTALVVLGTAERRALGLLPLRNRTPRLRRT